MVFMVLSWKIDFRHLFHENTKKPGLFNPNGVGKPLIYATRSI
jgi:hypothetical protein